MKDGLIINDHVVTATELFDRMPQLIFATDATPKTVYMNTRWCEYTGQSLDDLYRTTNPYIHADDLGAILVAWGKAMKDHHGWQTETRLRDDKGQYHWFIMSVEPIFQGGIFVGWFGIATNVDEQRSILTELQESERRKDEFIGMASHELKTPITSAKAMIQILQRKADDPKQEKMLASVDTQIDRLTRLVNDLLDVSKIKAGKLHITKEVVVLDEFVREVASGVQRNNHVIHFQGATGAQIALDKGRIAQVIQNLVTNAVKYSPNNKKIGVCLRTDGRKVTIGVKDWGIGIPPEQQKNIFDRFFRVEEQVAETFSGLGLGLYIASEIVHLHGGRIWVESELNKGSTFYFTLPL